MANSYVQKCWRDFVLFPVSLAIFAFAAVQTGCSPDKPKSTRSKTTNELKPMAKKKTDEISNPLQVRYANDENIKAAVELGQIAKDVNPADAPEFAKKMVQHLKNVTRILNENSDDCDKAAAALKKYVDDNKANIIALRKEGDEAQAKMNKEQKSKLSTQTILLMGPIAKDLALAQAHFATKCRQQAEEVAKQMQTVVGD